MADKPFDIIDFFKSGQPMPHQMGFGWPSEPQIPTATEAVAAAKPPNTSGRFDPSNHIFFPGNVSVDQNMQVAAQHQPWDLGWFKGMVQTGGPWDYKQLTPGRTAFENAGNFNYGATCAAMGLPQQLLDRAAGAYQILKGTSKPGWGNPFGAAPYGDDPKDQKYINDGIEYAKRQSR